MAILGTFSSFTAARLGIYASQWQLQVTGNNISNINTPGYTRQRGDLFSLNASGLAKYATGLGPNVGYGVLMNSVSQIRDPFLDIRFRNQNTKTAEAEATLAGLRKIAQTLDEVNQGGVDGHGVIEKALKEFKTMLQKLATDVGSEEYDSLVREAAKSLTAFFNTAADKLERDWELQKGELEDTVKAVNKCLTNIRDLNEQIRKQGIYGDNALELRDQRNLYIDELSSYLGIDVEYSMERIDQYTEVEKLTIYLKDTQDPRQSPGHRIKLVDGLYAAQLSFSTEEANPNYNAAQPQAPMPNPAYNPDDPNSLPYLDEDGKPTGDISKANMIQLNPDFTNYPLAINPDYDPDNPEKAGKYLTWDGKETNNINEAARVRSNPEYGKSVPMQNPEYPGDYERDGDGNLVKDENGNYIFNKVPQYVMKDGKLTDDVNEAARVFKNPKADPKDPNTWYLDADRKEIDIKNLMDEDVETDPVKTVARYLTTKGEPTDSVKDADKVGRYLNEKGQETNVVANAAPASRKYVVGVDENGNLITTNDPDKAAKVEMDPDDPRRFLLQVERLEDKFGVPMNRGEYESGELESVAIPLNDTDLQGAIQAMRELLTEEGEFASLRDIGAAKDMSWSDLRAADDKASIKKGIPYYMKRLDLLAQEFARVFNENNQMSASRVYESTGKYASDSLWYNTNSVSFVTQRAIVSQVYSLKTGDLPGAYVLGSPHDCFLKNKDHPSYHSNLLDSHQDNHIKGIIEYDSKGNIISIRETYESGSIWFKQQDLEKVRKQMEADPEKYTAVYEQFIAILDKSGRPAGDEGEGCFVEKDTGEFLAVRLVNGTLERVPLEPDGSIKTGYYLTKAEVERAATSDRALYQKYVEFLIGKGEIVENYTGSKDSGTIQVELEAEVFVGKDGKNIQIEDPSGAMRDLTRDDFENAKGDPEKFKEYMDLLAEKGKPVEPGDSSMIVYEECFLSNKGTEDEPAYITKKDGTYLTRADLEAAKQDAENGKPEDYLYYLDRLKEEGVSSGGTGSVCAAEDFFTSKYGGYITKDDGTPLTRTDLEAARRKADSVDGEEGDPSLYTQYLERLREEGTELEDAEPRYFWNKDNGLYIAVSIDKDGNVVEDYTTNGWDLTTTEVDRAEKEDPKLYAQYLDILREHGLLKEEYNYYDGGVLFSNSGNNNDPTGITAKNISISADWSARIVRVLNSKRPNEVGEDGKIIEHSSANDNIMHLLSLFDEQMDYCASDLNALKDAGEAAAGGNKPFFHGSFQEMYTDLGATLGMEQSTMEGIAYNYEVMTLDLDNDRISVYGVDLNDEATSMMQYQKSYQAACRLLTTIDSMLDTLINSTLR